ncbi:MAG: SLBB domain-containing protein [Gammaproteobacteria bacterium]|nr:SLBB domain-containing protein [Gammaproteobacteria bacterium]
MLLKLKALSVAGLIAASTMLMPTVAHAITPSPAMLAQFKQLPKAEQQRLMKQYGLSPQMLGGINQQSGPLETPELIEPRATKNSELQFNQSVTQKNNPYQEQALKPFGYDLFAGEPTTFAPVSDIPVPAQYIMGPGDQVSIQLYGKQNNQYDLTISRRGQLQVPELGPINVTGLTFNEMKQKLTKLIADKYIGMQVNISLGELRSIRVFVAGDAYKPGSYSVSSLSSITQVLYVAGGINDIGSLRNIQLKRNGKLITTFDLYDLLMKGDTSKDQRLQSGDVVFIPPVGATVSVKGEVRRPAIYELKGNETMVQLLRLAGGLKPGAYPAATIVERFNQQQLPSIININLTTKIGKQQRAKNGDVLIVKSTAKRVFKQIALMGAVNRPGLYQWHQGIRVNNIVKSTWSDLKNSADLNYALVVREINPQGDIEVHQINLQQAMTNPNSRDNIKLHARDTLMVFNDAPLSLEREQLDLFVSNQIAKFISKNYQLDKTAATPALFSAGFAKLNQVDIALIERHGAKKEQQQIIDQQELISAAKQVEKTLFKLFNDKKLLTLSTALTRQEMLYPVIAKLRTQQNNISQVQITSISGAVRFPGVYPLTTNQSVNGLLVAAGGLKDSAYINQAELTRQFVDNELSAKVEHFKVNLAALSTNTPYLLNSKDHLQVLTIPQWQKEQTVELLGEVKFPGIYTIKNGETMMSVIKRAGGLTTNAFVEGVVFTRESVKKQEKLQVIAMADQLRRDIATRGLSQEGNFINFDDASKMLAELEQLKTVGRMVIDLSALEANYLSNTNDATNKGLRLEHGDKLYVPSPQQIITVVGEVQHASSHFYEKGLDVAQYLTLAGGVKQRADDDRLYVIRANGAVFIPQQSYWFGQESAMQPGDTIVVPLDTEYKDNLTLWSQVTQIIYNTAVAFAAVNGI